MIKVNNIETSVKNIERNIKACRLFGTDLDKSTYAVDDSTTISMKKSAIALSFKNGGELYIDDEVDLYNVSTIGVSKVTINNKRVRSCMCSILPYRSMVRCIELTGNSVININLAGYVNESDNVDIKIRCDGYGYYSISAGCMRCGINIWLNDKLDRVIGKCDEDTYDIFVNNGQVRLFHTNSRYSFRAYEEKDAIDDEELFDGVHCIKDRSRGYMHQYVDNEQAVFKIVNKHNKEVWCRLL